MTVRLSVFRLSVRPSVRKEQLGSHYMDFHEIFKNLSRKFNFHYARQEQQALYMKPDIHL
jgi:hypothetical protein